MKTNGQLRGLGRRVLEELQASRNGNGLRRAIVQQGPITVEVEVSDLDRVGLASHRLTVRRSNTAALPEQTDSGVLQGQVSSIPERLAYLPEPLSPVELDARYQGATLRSDPPQETEDGRRFFELRLWGGHEVHVTRWHTQKGSNWRKPADFPLTHELFTRLVDDLAAMVAESRAHAEVS